MLNRGKKGLALLLSTVFAVAAVAGAFPVVTFAQDEPTQAVVVQQERHRPTCPRRNPGRRKKPPRSRRNRRSRRGNRRPTPRPCPRVRR